MVDISETNDRLNHIFHCEEGIQTNTNKSFILSVRPVTAANFKDFNPISMTNKYVGSNRNKWLSWLIKADLNRDELTFECKDYEKNSILLTNEYIISALEF